MRETLLQARLLLFKIWASRLGCFMLIISKHFRCRCIPDVVMAKANYTTDAALTIVMLVNSAIADLVSLSLAKE